MQDLFSFLFLVPTTSTTTTLTTTQSTTIATTESWSTYEDEDDTFSSPVVIIVIVISVICCLVGCLWCCIKRAIQNDDNHRQNNVEIDEATTPMNRPEPNGDANTLIATDHPDHTNLPNSELIGMLNSFFNIRVFSLFLKSKFDFYS